MRRIALVVLFLGAGTLSCWTNLPAFAQSVSPVIVEYKEKARGSFQVRNDLLVPLDVAIEAFSFDIDLDGRQIFRPLDSQIQLKLSKMSFRLAPGQTYTIFYEATATQLPAWFTIYSLITPPTRPGQMRVAMQLPHTVYLLSREPLRREEVVFLRAQPSVTEEGHEGLEIEVQNKGTTFARVQEVEVRSGSTKRAFAGFPFLPGIRRVIRLEWDGRNEGTKVALKFEHFRVESSLTSLEAKKLEGAEPGAQPAVSQSPAAQSNAPDRPH